MGCMCKALLPKADRAGHVKEGVSHVFSPPELMWDGQAQGTLGCGVQETIERGGDCGKAERTAGGSSTGSAPAACCHIRNTGLE